VSNVAARIGDDRHRGLLFREQLFEAVVNLVEVRMPGADPTTSSYNVSVAKKLQRND
jgi:hypothetical protein